jgi:hypothetical protein
MRLVSDKRPGTLHGEKWDTMGCFGRQWNMTGRAACRRTVWVDPINLG